MLMPNRGAVVALQWMEEPLQQAIRLCQQLASLAYVAHFVQQVLVA
jgi:hypothetical protein